jgi:hypothetical protein
MSASESEPTKTKAPRCEDHGYFTGYLNLVTTAEIAQNSGSPTLSVS